MKKLFIFSLISLLSANMQAKESNINLSYKAAQQDKYVPYYMEKYINKACDDCGDCSSSKQPKLFEQTTIQLVTQKAQNKKA